MSEVDQIDNVMTLEDLFLSAEFGKTVVDTPASAVEPLFLETSLGAPLLPLASFHLATGTHGTTTHMRRNRAFATASGVAAALLLAVGLISSTGKPSNSGSQTAVNKTTTTTTPKSSKSSGHPKSNVGPTGRNVPGSGGSTPGQALGPTGGSSHVVTTAYTVGGTGGGTVGGGTPGTPTKTPTPSNPAPSTTGTSGSVLSPVITLVGQVVVTTGNTVTGVGSTLTTALPPLAPVTNIVSGLGGTLSDLGNNLVIAAA
jgi:hypothetical protein